MITGLSHVSIVVPSLDAAAKRLKEVYGLDIGEVRTNEQQGVRMAYVELPNARIELMEPSRPDSPVSKFLEKNPAGGQHHVCFEVPDIHAAKAEMEAKGAKVLGEPRIGAHGTLVLFLHPKGTGGVLVELMESPRDAH